MSSSGDDRSKATRVRTLYEEAGVFGKAGRLIDKYRQRAEAVADQIEPEGLRALLYYLIDTVLADEADFAGRTASGCFELTNTSGLAC